MKSKHRRAFLNNYKWWDYSFLLQAIEDWCENASKYHLKRGSHLNNESIAKKLKVISVLCKRIREDDYNEHSVIFPKISCVFSSKRTDCGKYYEFVTEGHVPDEATYERVSLINHKYTRLQRENDLKYLLTLIEKNLFNFWD